MNAAQIPAKMEEPAWMDVLVTPVAVDLPTQELTVNNFLAIFEFTLAMDVIYQIKTHGGMTVTHTWRLLHMMPMATQSERHHHIKMVIRAQTGTNGCTLAHEHGDDSKSVSMILTITQMIHCLVKLLIPYLHMCHALM